MSNLLKLLFVDSPRAEIDEALERGVAEAQRKPVVPEALAKVLKAQGITGVILDDGCTVRLESPDAYEQARTALGSVESMAGLADAGWIATFGPQVTDTTDFPAQFLLYFIPLGEVALETGDGETNKQIDRDFKKSYDSQLDALADVDESVHASDPVGDDAQALMNRMLGDSDLTHRQVAEAAVKAGWTVGSTDSAVTIVNPVGTRFEVICEDGACQRINFVASGGEVLGEAAVARDIMRCGVDQFLSTYATV